MPRSEGYGLQWPDGDYFQTYRAAAPTNTRPPTSDGGGSFRLRGPVRPTFGVFADDTLDERRTSEVGVKALPMRWSFALVSPTLAAGLQNGKARVSNFMNPLLYGLRHARSDHGATGVENPMNWQPGYDDMSNLPRRTFPWTRNPRVTRWPIGVQSWPNFLGGTESS